MDRDERDQKGKPFPMPGTVWTWRGSDQAPPSGPHVVIELRWRSGEAEAVFAEDERYPGYGCGGVAHMMTLAAWVCESPKAPVEDEGHAAQRGGLCQPGRHRGGCPHEIGDAPHATPDHEATDLAYGTWKDTPEWHREQIESRVAGGERATLPAESVDVKAMLARLDGAAVPVLCAHPEASRTSMGGWDICTACGDTLEGAP